MKRGFIPLEIKHQKRLDVPPKAGLSLTGFTLIEILVALLILGLGVVSIFNLFPLALQALSYSRRLNEVSLLAQRKIDALKTQAENGRLSNTSGRDGNLNWSISCEPLQLTDGIDVILVELDVELEFQGKPQKHRFITYLYQK